MTDTQEIGRTATSLSDPNRPRFYPLDEIARLIPVAAGQPPILATTISRWISRGAKTRAHGRIFLEATRLPGRWVVSAESLDRFIGQLTEDHRRRAAGRSGTRGQD